MPVEKIDTLLDGYKADVGAWLHKVGVMPTVWRADLALRWLNNPPGKTLKAQSRALITATARPDYFEIIRSLFDAGLPFHLIGGSRSRGDWDVPQWVAERAKNNTDIPDTGHFMMMEAPEQFAAAVKCNLDVD